MSLKPGQDNCETIVLLPNQLGVKYIYVALAYPWEWIGEEEGYSRPNRL